MTNRSLCPAHCPHQSFCAMFFFKKKVDSFVLFFLFSILQKKYVSGRQCRLSEPQHKEVGDRKWSVCYFMLREKEATPWRWMIDIIIRELYLRAGEWRVNEAPPSAFWQMTVIVQMLPSDRLITGSYCPAVGVYCLHSSTDFSNLLTWRWPRGGGAQPNVSCPA